MLKKFSVSCLNLDFVAFSLLVKKTREKYGEISVLKKMREKLMLSALKAFHFQH
jgi:hypothetical protein